MNDDFQYSCRRRRARRSPVIARSEFLGAGSGGDEGGVCHYFNGTMFLAAPHVLVSAHPNLLWEAKETANVVSLLAGDEDGNGRVEVHGGQGVRITAGPPMHPEAENEAIKGVEIETDESYIWVHRQPLGGSDRQLIVLDRDLALLHASVGALGDDVRLTGLGMTISSSVSIQLKVGDLTSITLTDAGIIMKGPLININ
jgi:hypothetical protein